MITNNAIMQDLWVVSSEYIEMKNDCFIYNQTRQ